VWRVALIATGLAVTTACGASTPTGRSVAPETTQPLRVEPCLTGDAPRATHGPPDMTLRCFGSAGTVRLAGLRGTPTLVNVWASWCEPCRKEMPMLQAAHRRWGASIRMLGVDSRDESSAAAAFLTATGVTYPQAIDNAGQLPGRLGSPGLPVTIGIDADGNVVYQHAGKLAAADLTAIQHKLTRPPTN